MMMAAATADHEAQSRNGRMGYTPCVLPHSLAMDLLPRVVQLVEIDRTSDEHMAHGHKGPIDIAGSGEVHLWEISWSSRC